MLTKKQQIQKRLFDIVISFFGLLVFILPIIILTFLATISTKQIGLYTQLRIGRFGKLFTMFKIRTMKMHDKSNNITVLDDSRITKFGKILRKSKLDELPQLFNVLIGDMSFVGPRPDVKGYADELVGENQIILQIRPGITGPATLRYRNEEELLNGKENPKEYNDTIIWNEKVKLNIEYIKSWTFLGDINYIFQTIFH